MMDGNTINIMEECTKASLDGRMSFPEVVRRLREIGVEYYRVDLFRQEKITYLPNGESYRMPVDIPEEPIAEAFSTSEVIAAIRASRRGEHDYRTFLQKIMRAGVVSYCVFITGERAVYTGRRGESHVELFPPRPALVDV